MRIHTTRASLIALFLAVLTAYATTMRADDTPEASLPSGHHVRERQDDLIAEGERVFRFDTFGDEEFWGDTLRLHQAIEGAALGGVGPGVSPKMALAAGLKVDVEALPHSLVEQLRQGRVDLNSPATTVALLKLNAVVGITGFFTSRSTLRSVGIQCALCHSTVDDSLAPGIGHRRDGWGQP